MVDKGKNTLEDIVKFSFSAYLDKDVSCTIYTLHYLLLLLVFFFWGGGGGGGGGGEAAD